MRPLFSVIVTDTNKADESKKERGANEFPCCSILESKPGFCTGKGIDL
jgi:hypothetical protein